MEAEMSLLMANQTLVWRYRAVHFLIESHHASTTITLTSLLWPVLHAALPGDRLRQGS
jgi:hypothetical protein